VTVVEVMVAEIDGWDADLRVLLPTAQHFRYRVLATNMREFLWRRMQGPPGTRPVSAIPKLVPVTLGLTEMQIKDTGGTRGVSAWVSAAHPLRLRTCRLVTDRSNRPDPHGRTRPWPGQVRLGFLAVTCRHKRTAACASST
jgi:hypothetical protein